jgi:predicted enzyme related to lactoylglutathione lyase
MASPRIRTLIINTEQPQHLVMFWSSFLEVDIKQDDPGSGIVWLQPDTDGGVNLGFQRVHAKLGHHTETHLDIAVSGLDHALRRIEELGGRLVQRNTLDSGFEWRVCADPDGNEFCIFVGH